MTPTTERFDPSRLETTEDRAMALFQRYAYTVAAGHIQPGDRVLDVGFGAGYGAEILSAADYLGVELDKAVVAQARSRYPGAFERYDGLRLPPGPFDLASEGASAWPSR